MSSRRYFVDKHDGDNSTGAGDPVSQVGGGSKTSAKAQQVTARMRAQQTPGSSNWFTVREGKKS